MSTTGLPRGPDTLGGPVRLRVVMVSDIVGSTTLRAALGERHATEVFSTLETTTAEVVTGFGGRVVKHLGDGTLAVFESATEALDAAVAVQVSAAELADAAEPAAALAIRVGLAVGDVDSVGEDVAGMPVVVAARLCDRAEDGTILADRLLAELSWERTGGRVESLGALELKGCPRPTEVVRVPWERPARTAQIPALLSRKLHHPFVGRGGCLERLDSAWAEVLAGESLVVSIAGEAGMGKTTLLAQFAASLARSGADVLAGTCVEGPQAPFPAWSQAIDEYARQMSYPALVAAAGADRRVLARLAPSLAERMDVEVSGDAVDTPQRLHESVAAFLSRRARVTPLLVVLDDLQWGGEDSAQMLRGVTAGVEGPVLFAVAHRDTDVEAGHSLVAALEEVAGRGRLRAHRLDGLRDIELDELAAAMGSRADMMGEEQLRELQRMTGGNPLFARELVRGGVGDDPDAVSSARGLVRRRVGALAEGTQRLLSVASLLGPVFEVSTLLRCVPGVGDEELLAELENARSAGIIDEMAGHPDRMVFMHGLVPEVLASELSSARRARLHLRIADALAGQAPAATRAHHYVRSRLVEALEPAAELSRSAAGEQARALAYEQACTTLLDALGFIEEVAPQRHDLTGWLHADLAGFRYEIGEIEGRRDSAARAGRAARATGDTALLQRAAILRAGFPQPGHPDPLAVELLEEAIDTTEDAEAGVKAELLSVLAYYRGINEGRRDDADALVREAISIARNRGSERDLAEALAARSFLLTGAPGLEEQLGICGELASLVDRLDSEADRERHLQYVHRQRGPLRLRGGDRVGFVAELEALERFGRQRRSWIALATSLMWRGMLAHAEGDLDEAERHYDEMAAVGMGQANFAESYAFALFVLRRDQGRLGELVELTRAVVASSGEFRAFEPALAVVELEDGDPEESERIWREWAKDSFARLPHDVTESGLLPLLAELCVRFGTPEQALRLEGLLAPYAGELVVAAWGICCLGPVDRYRAMLLAHGGQPDRAAALRESADRLESSVGFAAARRMQLT